MDLKKLELSYHLVQVFKHMESLNHKSDGIIFTSAVAPYSIGTCDKMLKWKPSNENSVDFKVTRFNNSNYFISIYVGNEHYQEISAITLSSDETRLFKNEKAVGRIIECCYDPNHLYFWKFMRWRDDKEHGNHISTFKKIQDSISDNVEKDELIRYVDVIKSEWKKREAISK